MTKKNYRVGDETLKQVAPRVTALLQRQDLDKMEREILEGASSAAVVYSLAVTTSANDQTATLCVIPI